MNSARVGLALLKKKRESPQINANRIFLAPSCSAPAYRLRRNRTPSGKVHELKARETSQEPLALGQMLSEKPACRFFS